MEQNCGEYAYADPEIVAIPNQKSLSILKGSFRIEVKMEEEVMLICEGIIVCCLQKLNFNN